MTRSLKKMLLAILLFVSAVSMADDKNLYVTWEGSEPDKGASVWLIKTFINQKAQFRFQKPGTDIEVGQAFDVPQSKYRRSHRYTTFESLLQDHPVSDPILDKMTKIIHDLEINTWGDKLVKESPVIEMQYRQMAKIYGKTPIPFECGQEFFKRLYNLLKTGQQISAETTLIPKRCQLRPGSP